MSVITDFLSSFLKLFVNNRDPNNLRPTATSPASLAFFKLNLMDRLQALPNNNPIKLCIYSKNGSKFKQNFAVSGIKKLFDEFEKNWLKGRQWFSKMHSKWKDMLQGIPRWKNKRRFKFWCPKFYCFLNPDCRCFCLIRLYYLG